MTETGEREERARATLVSLLDRIWSLECETTEKVCSLLVTLGRKHIQITHINDSQFKVKKSEQFAANEDSIYWKFHNLSRIQNWLDEFCHLVASNLICMLTVHAVCKAETATTAT